MPARLFIDTNVVVYAFDPRSPEKQRKAKQILRDSEWMISWQVVQEFSSVALHRFEVPLKPQDLQDYVALKLWPHCRVFPSEVIYRKAIELHERFGFRYYDSLILSGALAGGATQLLTEDLQSGQTIGSLRIVNPFAVN